MTKYDWWGYVKGMIRRYPRLAKQDNLTGIERREWEAVTKAIAITAQQVAGEERLKLVDLIFWRRSHTLPGAAMELHCSERTAQRWHTDFIYTTARAFGLLD